MIVCVSVCVCVCAHIQLSLSCLAVPLKVWKKIGSRIIFTSKTQHAVYN